MLAVCIWIACVGAVAGSAKRVEAAPGAHLRFRTEHGAVHVWTPARYDRTTAGVVLYVHGYFTTVDRAWREHRLAQQFAASGINALFVACEAPAGPDEDVHWTSVEALLGLVAEHLDDGLPEGRVIAVGHSGAHRTLSMWLAEDRLNTVVLVDAFYGDMPQLRSWLDADPDRRLINAAAVTRKWTDELHAALPDTLTFRRFPAPGIGKLRGARQARVVYVRSQHDHMKLVTGGIALPMLLRAVQLPALASASRKAPTNAP